MQQGKPPPVALASQMGAVQVLAAPLHIHLLANGLGKAVRHSPSYTHVRDLGKSGPGYGLAVRAVAGIWGANQWMGDLLLSVALSF